MTTTAPAQRPRPSLLEWRDAPREKSHRKYANEPTTVDGLRFDSRAEAKRWFDLLWRVKAGEIADLERQVRYVLIPKQARPSGGVERECAYIADFTYLDKRTGRSVCEDVKGCATPEFRIKRKLLLLVHGIELVEVKS
jgi:hypothetical protein